MEKANSHWISGIAIEGDVVRGQQYVPFARRLLRNLSERMKLGDIALGRDFARLADDAYCYAIIHNSIHRCVIVVDEHEAVLSPSSEDAITEYPDFYSGFVLNARSVQTTPPGSLVPTDVLPSFLPTRLCSDLHDIAEAPQQTVKLHVKAWDALGGDLTHINGVPVTQYAKIKPTMYSGRMRKCVQVLMGFGKQHKKSIYERDTDEDESASERAPSRYQREVSRFGVQVRYDWRWFRTHGILRGPDGKDWLIEVGPTRGVVAMPLPVHERTKEPAFRDYLEEINDSAALAILDEFGAFPSGETFPAGDIEAWIRAGRVVRLADPDDLSLFYSRSEYSSAMGWAFNTSGTAAVNTCWSYDGKSYQTGYLFELVSAISSMDDRPPARNSGRLKEVLQEYDPDESERTRYEAALWKVNRLHEETIRDILAMNRTPKRVFEATDLAYAVPPASGSATLKIQSSGTLYWPYQLQPYIKFPEPAVGYLVSHNMFPRYDLGPAPVGEDASSNTIVHAFFIEDELHYCRFVCDVSQTGGVTVDSDFADCMYVGTYTQTTYSAGRFVPPMMVTERFDDRAEIAPTISSIRRSGSSIGYTSVATIDNPVRPNEGTLHRVKTFRIETESRFRSGIVHTSGVTVPFYDRCSYFYSYVEGAAVDSYVFSVGYSGLGDPNSCPTWRNFPGYTGFLPSGCFEDAPAWPSCWTLGEHPEGCGKVFPRTVRYSRHEPYPCSEFADSGKWCDVCDNADTMRYSIPLPPGESDAWNNGGQYFRSTWLISESPRRIEVIEDRFTRNGGNYQYPWFRPSPDENGDVQYSESTTNIMGEATTARTVLPIFAQDPTVRLYGTPLLTAPAETLTCIGVIP